MLWTGPPDASHRLILAPGDEGRVTDSHISLIAEGLGDAGVRVGWFGFACHSDDSAERDTLLAESIRTASRAEDGGRLVLGGLSRGARVSAALATELGAVGLLAFAYPFHARNDPDPHGRVDDLAAVPVPVMLFQGTRDSHGNQQQVRGYRLPSHIRVHWLEDANHALHPRASSGSTQAEQLRAATSIAAEFIRSL